MVYRLLLVLHLLFLTNAVAAQSLSPQDEDTSRIADAGLISRYIKEVDSKARHTDEKLDKYTTKTLRRWIQQEEKIKRRLAKKDSVKAVALFGNADEQYKQLQTRLDKSASLVHYVPTIDTATTSLKFLLHNQKLFAATEEKQQKLKEAMAKVKVMEGQFQKAEEMKKFLSERKELLKKELSKFGFAKELKKLSKQGYYYQQQIEEYKTLLTDHRKAERKALELLGKSNFFQSFFRKNSMLASLFRLPGDPDDPVSTASLTGLQTRASVNTLIQQQIGPNGQARFQQNMQDAQSQLQKIKDKVTQFGSSNGDGELPEGFRPNPEKTKTLFQRLEYSANMQSQKATAFFPTRSDIGLSIGYRISDKNVVGAGLSYRVGWGRGWNNIRISHLGMGIRSFWDWKLKGSFWLSTGYEMNYNNEIRNIQELKNRSAWTNSGLAGLSKIVSLRTKFFKKTKVSLLWDFLANRQIPRSSSLLFRVGYHF